MLILFYRDDSLPTEHKWHFVSGAFAEVKFQKQATWNSLQPSSESTLVCST